MKYTKPVLTYENQAALLVKRGLVIADKKAFMCHLESVGYYRLCSYWHLFQEPDGSFKPGTTFEEVWKRYVFDRHLRLIVMDAIERVEVAVRTALVTDLALAYGQFAHTDLKNFPLTDPERHRKFNEELETDAYASKEQFVSAFKANYEEFPALPIWAAAETMTFGSMFTLFNMSRSKIQQGVARRYDLQDSVLQSWLRTLLYARNICAHHARLWNRELAIKPILPNIRNGPLWHRPIVISNSRVFVVLTLLNYMLEYVAPQSHWRDRLFALLDRFPTIPLHHMGIPASWRTHPLWLPPPPSVATGNLSTRQPKNAKFPEF